MKRFIKLQRGLKIKQLISRLNSKKNKAHLPGPKIFQQHSLYFFITTYRSCLYEFRMPENRSDGIKGEEICDRKF
jgi:hypothetical protein